MNPIYTTGAASLVIQVITGIFDIHILSMKFSPEMALIKSLLWIELLVQIIEGIFYVWLVVNFAKIKNITQFRYYDWVITTPTMLFTYSMYLIYLKMKNDTNKQSSDKSGSFYEIVKENTPILVPIFILNTLMLLCGYLAEIGKITANMGALLGFLPFFAFFYLIYENYAKYTNIGKYTFYYFSGIWALYGIASILPYKYKNVIYNILDLFAKNFFGIFLGVILLLSRK